MSGSADPSSDVDPDKHAWPALSKSATQALCEEAATIFANGLGADRTAILYRDEQGEWILGAHQGFPRFSLHNVPISLSILEDAAVRGRTTLSNDARTDHETQQTLSLQLSEAVSILCVPFSDSTGAPVGAIYGDTIARLKAFGHKELRFARGFASWLEARFDGVQDVTLPTAPAGRASRPTGGLLQGMGGRGSPESDHARGGAGSADPGKGKANDGGSWGSSTTAPGQVDSSRFGIRTAATLFGLLGLFVVLWLLAPAARAPGPASEASQVPERWASDPSAVINSFHHLLLLRQFDQAWNLLHPDLQKSIPLPEFQTRVTAWMADEAQRWDYSRRVIRKGATNTDAAQCYLDQGNKRSELPPWEWGLRRLDGHWRISKMRGGPLSAEP